MFARKQPALIDDRLNEFRPTLSSTMSGWMLTVALDENTSIEMKIKNTEMRVYLKTGNEFKTLGPKQWEQHSQKTGLPIARAIECMVERWRFLNLLVETS